MVEQKNFNLVLLILPCPSLAALQCLFPHIFSAKILRTPTFTQNASSLVMTNATRSVCVIVVLSCLLWLCRSFFKSEKIWWYHRGDSSLDSHLPHRTEQTKRWYWLPYVVGYNVFWGISVLLLSAAKRQEETSQSFHPNHRGAPILSCKIPNLGIHLLATATPPVQGEWETIPADFRWKVGYALSVTGLKLCSCVNQHVLFTMVESHLEKKSPFRHGDYNQVL